MKAVKMVGEKSNGMCLSEKELGISDNHEGVMVLDKNTKFFFGDYSMVIHL